MKNTQTPETGAGPQRTPAPKDDARVGGERPVLRIVRGLKTEAPEIPAELGEAGLILSEIYREAEIAAAICDREGHRDIAMEIISRAGLAVWGAHDLVNSEDVFEIIHGYGKLREMLSGLYVAMKWAADRCGVDIDKNTLDEAIRVIIKAAWGKIGELISGEGSE